MKYKLPIILIAIGLIAFATVSFAMPSFFPTNASSAVATTTLNYFTPGTATTTIVYDVYSLAGTNQTSSGNRYAADKATLLLQFTASSTSSVLVSTVEYSMDGIDWYQNNTETYAAGAIAVAIPNTYTWTFASTTSNGLIQLTKNNKAITIATPTRFVRVVLSMTGANGAAWAAIQPMKQQAQP